MPDLNYPKGGNVFLVNKVAELSANVCDLLDELARRDATIVQQTIRIKQLENGGDTAAKVEPPPEPPAA